MALCHGRNGDQEVNMMLVGPQQAGTWVLNFLGSAREVMTADDAAKMDSALEALAAIASGEKNVYTDSFFPDLVATTEEPSPI